MVSPFSLAMVRCHHPEGCPAEGLLPRDDDHGIEEQLARIGWLRHDKHGWICPRHDRTIRTPDRMSKLILTHRTRALIKAIHDGHDFGMAIMRETGLSESTVYATLRRLQEAGLAVCELESADVAMKRHRPRRKTYRLTELLLNELGWHC